MIISIFAVIISPLIAIWVGEEIRKNNYQKEREDRLLEKLVANRYMIYSDEFLGALNSINFVFSRNEKIKELVKNLHRAYVNKEDVDIVNQRMVELIYEICKYKRYNITDGNSNNSEQPTITSSSSVKLITGDYLSSSKFLND